jgi:hypothetical protein
MGVTVLDLESALGHAAEAGPELVHERGVGLGVALGEARAGGVDPHPERNPAMALRDISLSVSRDDHGLTDLQFAISARKNRATGLFNGQLLSAVFTGPVNADAPTAADG